MSKKSTLENKMRIFYLLFAILILGEMFATYETVAWNVAFYVLINLAQLILLLAMFLRFEVFNDEAKPRLLG